MTLDRVVRKVVVVPAPGDDPSVGAEYFSLYNPDGTPAQLEGPQGEQGETGPAGPDSSMVGEMKIWPFASTPTGWQICDGSVAASQALLDKLDAEGRPHGGSAGAGLVPDMRGRIPVGLGTHADVNSISDNDGVATVANRRPKHAHTQPTHTHTQPAHTHTVAAHTHSIPSTNRQKSGTDQQPTGDAGNTGSGGGGNTGSSGGDNTGAGGGDNTGDAGASYQVINFIIKT